MTSSSSTNPHIQQFLEGNAKFQPTWKNPFSMEQMRSREPTDGGPLLVCTHSLNPCILLYAYGY